MGRRISKEFLHPSILEGVNDKIGNLDSLETDAKGNMVQAINELVEKLDNSAEIENGKELIANAVGEPLTAEDSFDEMSSDINSLLSTFKTNMMNNGITVESNDRFKQLIDKIATMVEEGSSKGIQYASGTGSSVPTNSSITINTNLEFIPTIVFCHFPILRYSSDNSGNDQHANVCICSTFPVLDNNWASTDCDRITIGNITQSSFKLTTSPAYGGEYSHKVWTEGSTTWFAIGVGEEDTALRDSLADILENKGVDVTEEDDMASLITKVDSISGGLDIMSATELPDTGKHDQICVITDNPIDNFLITTNFNDTQSTSAICIYLGDPEDVLPNSALTITKGNVTNNYYFNRICQQNKRLASYHYANNQWNLLTKATIPVYENNSFPSKDVLGTSPVETSGNIVYISGNEIVFKTSDYSLIGFSFSNIIDFSSYHKVIIVARHLSGTVVGNLYVASMKQHYTSVINLGTNTITTNHAYSWVKNTVSSATETVLTYDISSFTGSGYLGIIAGGSSSTFYIQEIILE